MRIDDMENSSIGYSEKVDGFDHINVEISLRQVSMIAIFESARDENQSGPSWKSAKVW
jgi:hypothetical protein